MSVLSYVIGRYTLGYFIPFFWIPIAAIIILSGLILLSLKKELRNFLTMKSTRQGVGAGLQLIVLVLAVLFVNALSLRYDLTYDFSPMQSNSLSVTSYGVVQRLKEPARVVFFYRQGNEKSQMEKRKFIHLMRKYNDITSRLKVDFIEVSQNPGEAQSFGVDRGSGVVFVEYKDQRSRIDRITEENVTQALDIVTRAEKKTVYFLRGHGEKEWKKSDSLDGIKSITYLLEGNGYVVEPLSLITKTRVPSEVKTLFIVSPQEELLGHESKALIAFLKRGGRLFLALDPLRMKLSSLQPLLQFLGVNFENQYVIGLTETKQGWALTPKLTLAPVFHKDHEISQNFKEGKFVVLRTPGFLSKMKKAEESVDRVITPLLQTNQNVRAFVSLDMQGEQKPGPFTISMAVEVASSGAKVVVVSSSSFMTNQLWSHGVNRDFLLNVTSFLSDQSQSLKIEPAHWSLGKFTLTPDGLTLYALLFAGPLPMVLLGIGVFLYVRRRRD